jgi:hypothetical protein
VDLLFALAVSCATLDGTARPRGCREPEIEAEMGRWSTGLLALAVLVIVGACEGDDPTRAPEAAGEAATATATTVPDGERAEHGEAAGEAGSSSLERRLTESRFRLGLTLRSATIEKLDLDNDEREFVRLCFGDEVQHVEAPEAFHVQGFDPRTVLAAEELAILESDRRCVLAGFAAGTDLGAFSLAGVRAGAVRHVSGDVNPPDNEALSGGRPTRIDAPVLVSVERVERTLERVTFRFSRPLDESGAEASSFGYYTAAGVRYAAAV